MEGPECPIPRRLNQSSSCTSLSMLRVRPGTATTRPGCAGAATGSRYSEEVMVGQTSRSIARTAAHCTKVHRDPGEALVGLLSGVRALKPGEPQDPSAIPVPRVPAHRERRRQCSEEPPPVRDIAGTQGCGQTVLGGGDSSKTPSWRGQPGQGTGGKPGQRPGAATGPRTLVHPASRKGLSARPWDGYTGGRVRGSSTCGNQGACHQLMGLCHLFPHLTAWVGRQRGSWCSPYRPLPCARHGLARSAAVEEDLADGVPRAY